MKSEINKKLIIDLGLRIFDKFSIEEFLIFVKLSGLKLNDFSDYISKHNFGFIKEQWKNKKFIAKICGMKGCI